MNLPILMRKKDDTNDWNDVIGGLCASSNPFSALATSSNQLVTDPYMAGYQYKLMKNGGRLYILNEVETVHLTGESLVNIRSMNNTIQADSRFVNIMLQAVFGRKILETSNMTGNSSNATEARFKHKLNSIKLQFIRDIYLTRCMGDDSRMKKFNMLVNKKCTNLARASKNFKPAARRVKKTEDFKDVPNEQPEVDRVVVEDNVESEEVAKDEEL